MVEFQGMANKADEGVKVDAKNRRVSFGERARFADKDYNLSTASAERLREFAPVVLRFADTGCGKKLLKRVVVEGYTSKTGSYLVNLDLSLKRAHSVLCALLDPQAPVVSPLSENQKQHIRTLFFVGGYSFNAGKGSTEEEDRRVELKLEFWGLDEKAKIKDKNMDVTDLSNAELGVCMLPRHVITH